MPSASIFRRKANRKFSVPSSATHCWRMSVYNEDGIIDFTDGSKTENTRVSYPINHIANHEPSLKAGHPQNIIFLTCDAFGVLPPVSKLSKEQAMYYFLSGYTAKVAGTERGITEPQAAFSACFGEAFLPLHPTAYAKLLGKKMEDHNVHAYLVNTGWAGGRLRCRQADEHQSDTGLHQRDFSTAVSKMSNSSRPGCSGWISRSSFPGSMRICSTRAMPGKTRKRLTGLRTNWRRCSSTTSRNTSPTAMISILPRRARNSDFS